MAYFVILTSDGNLVESFDDEAEARAALEGLARSAPEAADEYAMLTYGDDGLPVGEALPASDARIHA
jgi:hypothetical protein